MTVSIKITMYLLFDSGTPFLRMLGLIFLDVENDESEKLFNAAFLVRAKYWEQPKCVVSRCVVQ